MSKYISRILPKGNIKIPCFENANTEGRFHGWEHDWNLDVLEKRNGVKQVSLRCARCRIGRSVSYDELAEFGVHPDDLQPTRTHLGEVGECIVDGCYQIDVELHHFAPKSVFGLEADDYPIMPLCRNHHIHWHMAMDGYVWNSARRSLRDRASA